VVKVHILNFCLIKDDYSNLVATGITLRVMRADYDRKCEVSSRSVVDSDPVALWLPHIAKRIARASP
jgi:hypothetical protein